MPDAPAGIVVLDPAFIGDVVFDGPLVRALKQRHPTARIGLVVRPPADAIARRMVGVDRVHTFDKHRSDRGLAGLRRLARELAEARYDLALVPHPSIRTALLARLAGIATRVGNASWPARALLTEAHPIDRPLTRFLAAPTTHVAARLAMVDPVGSRDLAGTLRRDRGPPRPLPEASWSARRIALALGANWATKRWPIPRFIDLARMLLADGHRLVLVGSDAERPLAAALTAELPPDAAVEDAMGGSLDDLLDRLAACDLVVGGDTGPVHAARALGLPAVLLFGPTPEAAHDLGPRDRALVVPLDCRPCDAHGPAVCPLGHHRCLHDLDAARVAAAVRELLDRAPAG